MTTFIKKTEDLDKPETAKPETRQIEQRLTLASDNPAPEAGGVESEPVSASIQMATYRLAATFGELRWIAREVA